MTRKQEWNRRCPWAIQFGTLATRCKKLLPGHGEMHTGRGLRRFPYQEIDWPRGHRAEFKTDREDFYAWEVKNGKENRPGSD